MANLTPAQIREHVETDLSDEALQRHLDAAAAMIERFAGPAGEVTEHSDYRLFPYGRDRVLFLTMSADSITEVIERDDLDDPSPRTLSANDYRLRGRRELIRLRNGDNPRQWWAEFVEVTFQRVDYTAEREQAEINLVQLLVQYQGIEDERYGDVNLRHGALSEQSEQVRAALAPLASSKSRPFPVI